MGFGCKHRTLEVYIYLSVVFFFYYFINNKEELICNTNVMEIGPRIVFHSMLTVKMHVQPNQIFQRSSLDFAAIISLNLNYLTLI